jgi:hypothetical protein
VKGSGFLSNSSVQLRRDFGSKNHFFQRECKEDKILTVRVRSTPSIANHLKGRMKSDLSRCKAENCYSVPITMTSGRWADAKMAKRDRAHILNLCEYVSQSTAAISLSDLFPSNRSCHVGDRRPMNMRPSPGRASKIIDFHTAAFSCGLLNTAERSISKTWTIPARGRT